MNIKSWDGSKFFYPDAKNADTTDQKHAADFAAASHQHVKAAITDFPHKSSHAVGGNDVITPADIAALALTGGVLTGKLTVAAGADKGIWFPDNAFGGAGDTAGIYLTTKTGEDIELTIAVTNDIGDTINFKSTDATGAAQNDNVRVNGNKIWNAGNFNPANYSLTTHNHAYDVNGDWLKDYGDNGTVKLYGNVRQMAFRTDGATEYATGVGGYPFVWMYGGDAASNRLAAIQTDGDLWTVKTGLLSTALNSKVDKTSLVNRPGVTKLYRNDNDSNYSVQTNWTGTLWALKGYMGDAFHAECWVGQAGNADTVDNIHSTSFVRTDAAGVWTLASSSAASAYSSAIQIRELGFGGVQTDDWTHAPRLAFHWSGRVASQIALASNGRISIINNPGTALEAFQASQVYGAVYNDYAEYRQSKEEIKAGYIVADTDNGYVAKTTKRLAKAAMVVSDTFGFAIGQQEISGEYSLAIAVAGRVLVYTDKDRNSFKVGDVVCAGKHGTVSKMNFFEKILFPDRILGVVSEIPTYEEWGNDKVKVNNRIWIKVK